MKKLINWYYRMRFSVKYYLIAGNAFVFIGLFMAIMHYAFAKTFVVGGIIHTAIGITLLIVKERRKSNPASVK